MRKRILFIIALFILLMTASALGLLAEVGFAQGEGIQWQDPINLSESGFSTTPYVVVGNEDPLGVFWSEADLGVGPEEGRLAFSGFDGGEWQSGEWFSSPIAGRPYMFKNVSDNVVVGLWIDDDLRLRANQVSASQVGDPLLWNRGLGIAQSVIAFDAAVDSRNNLHVVIMTVGRTGIGPAGIYHLRNISGSSNWTAATRIYTSDYFMRFADSLTGVGVPEEVDPVEPFVDVEIAEIAQDNVMILAMWDNPSIKRVYMSSSSDNGNTFSDPIEVRGPDPENPYEAPRQLRIIAQDEMWLRLWQVAGAGGSCSQVYQFSRDAGQIWGVVKPLLEDFSGCPENLQSFSLDDQYQVLFFTHNLQAYMMAWNGERWSPPVRQEMLNAFIDPFTLNFVELGCHHAAIIDSQIFVVGCDKGSGGDIWLVQGEIQAVEEWFDTESGWDKSMSIELETDAFYSLDTAVDGTGTLHALWSQPAPQPGDTNESQILYASLQDGRAIGPYPVIDQIPEPARNLTLAVSPGNRLFAVWNAARTGEIHYSTTSVLEASSAVGWQQPRRLAEAGITAIPSDLEVDPAGKLYLAYSIPANDHRGVYITYMDDDNQGWSEPIQISDGTGIDCDMFIQPRLAISAPDDLHVLWTCSSLPGGIGPLEGYYARSIDGGSNWSAPQRLVDKAPEWSELLVDSQGTVHTLWTYTSGDQPHIRHRISVNNGETWQDPETIFDLTGSTERVAVSIDPAGNLHLLQLNQSEQESSFLDYRQWTGSVWRAREKVYFRFEPSASFVGLSTSNVGDERLAAVYLRSGLLSDEEERISELVFQGITLDSIPLSIGGVDTDEAAELNPAEEATITPAATQESEENQQLEVDTQSRLESGGRTLSFIPGLIIGALIAIGLVVLVVVQRLHPPE